MVVKFLTGGISSINNVEIIPGQIIFALSDDKEYGYIVYDNIDGERMVMCTKAVEAEKLSHKLTIGEYTFNGSQDIKIPISNIANSEIDEL